ncbi:MAG: FG-GAP repeat protein [Planctomycetes bacterium]|nr:FG-GAP repeat protein [Planctomycetota bacterium]
MGLLCTLFLAAAAQNYDAILLTENASPYSDYASAIAISGDWAFVGAPDDQINGTNYIGSVLVYQKTANGWIESQKLLASDGQLFHTFGHSLAADGNRLVVGAPDALGNSIGAAYIFEYNGSQWIETQKVAQTTGYGDDWFGWSVDIEGDRVVVGAMYSHYPGLSWSRSHAGSGWIFDYDGAQWNLTQEISASDKDFYDLFGASIALDGDKVLVGARGEGDDIGGGIIEGYKGAAYVFQLNAGTWVETQKLIGSTREEHAWFGNALDIKGNHLLVGSPGKNGGGIYGSGVVYAFRFSAGSWNETAILKSPLELSTRTFGQAIAMENDFAVIAAAGYDFLGNDTGAVHPWRRYGNEWIPEPAINPGTLHTWDGFARDVDLDGSAMLTCAYLEHLPAKYAPGAGFIYDLSPRFHLIVPQLPFDIAEDAKMEIRFATPNSLAWLAYSLTGPGSTPIPPLGVVLDLANPKQLGNPVQTDASGYAKWEMAVPISAQGLTVWLQAVQAGQTTNLIRSTIR